jgi:predicted  nucleic acid-binding Zn-ribbon protein
MKTKTLRRANLVFITAVFFAIASVSFAAQTSADKTTTKKVKEKVAEAAEAIGNYSVDQRDEATKKAKVMLDDLDARIDTMETRLNEKWDQMDQLARKKATATLTALRKQRNEIAEWYGGLKHSSSNAWEDVKKGFLKSYHELRNIFDKVQSEF